VSEHRLIQAIRVSAGFGSEEDAAVSEALERPEAERIGLAAPERESDSAESRRRRAPHPFRMRVRARSGSGCLDRPLLLGRPLKLPDRLDAGQTRW
jgi:hypothetical protein